MRLQFKGNYSFKEFKEALDRVIDNLESNNIDGISSLNLYFTPVKSGTPVILTDKDGAEIDHLVMNPDIIQKFNPVTQDLFVNRLVDLLDAAALERIKNLRPEEK